MKVFDFDEQYELKELKRRQEEEERIRAEELAAHEAALAALHSPPEGTHPDQYVFPSIHRSISFTFSIINIPYDLLLSNKRKNRDCLDFFFFFF